MAATSQTGPAGRVSWYGRMGVPARAAEVKIPHKSMCDTLASQGIHQLILPLAISSLTLPIKGVWISVAAVSMSEALKEAVLCRTPDAVLCSVWITLSLERTLANCS